MIYKHSHFLFICLSFSDSHTQHPGNATDIVCAVNSVRSDHFVVRHPSHPSAPAAHRLQIVHSGIIFHDHLLLNLISWMQKELHDTVQCALFPFVYMSTTYFYTRHSCCSVNDWIIFWRTMLYRIHLVIRGSSRTYIFYSNKILTDCRN